MQCATKEQLFNFLVATTGTVIIDCRNTEHFSKHRLKYPLLIHLPHDKLPHHGHEAGSLCEHVTSATETSNGPTQQLSDQDLIEAIKGIELVAGPYDRCVLRTRSKATIILVNESEQVPPKVASLVSVLLQEGKCAAVYHTAFLFDDFGTTFPFHTERFTVTRKASNCSLSMPRSISLELDDFQIVKQKQALIPQFPNCILSDGLYLGTRQQALDHDMMRRMGITHIIRAHDVREQDFTVRRNDAYQRIDSVHYLDVAVDDKLGTNILMFLKPCINFYEEARRKTRNCKFFVHCNMGISRSATIIISILMSQRNMNLKCSLEYAKQCRNQVQPNYSFMKELIKYEKILFGTNSLKMDDLIKLNAHYSRAYAIDMQDSKPCSVM